MAHQAFSRARELDAAPDEGGDDRDDPPAHAVELEAEKCVDGQPAGADEGEAQRRQPEDQGVFVAAFREEEAVLPVHADRRHQHHSRHGSGGTRRDESERQHEAADRFRQPGEKRIAPARNEAEALEGRGGFLETEEFLHSVRCHGQAENQPKNEKSAAHVRTSRISMEDGCRTG